MPSFAPESVAFGINRFVEFPSRDVCDKAFEVLMADPRMAALGDMPFDGKRMIFGGFSVILDA